MNETQFSGLAEVYEEFRPGYPAALLDYLYSQAGMPAFGYVADIGSGTGILSEAMLQRGSVIYAVEPDEQMREKAEEKLRGYANFISVAASAEKTGLAGNSIDFITVAQAFHWFDRAAFLAEAKRILKPEGKVSLIWNSRDENSALVKETKVICERFCPLFKGFSGGQAHSTEAFDDFFLNGTLEAVTFENSLRYVEETFIGRHLSASYAPRKKEKHFNQYVNNLKKVFNQYVDDGGYVQMDNITYAYIGNV